MGKLDGRVAVITGGARGQGRSHARTLAAEGADIAFCDLPAQIANLPYETATEADMAETVSIVEGLDRRCIGMQGDARDPKDMEALLTKAATEFGKVDILVVNHGIATYHEVKDMADEVWQDVIDVNLTGAFNAVRAALPFMF